MHTTCRSPSYTETRRGLELDGMDGEDARDADAVGGGEGGRDSDSVVTPLTDEHPEMATPEYSSSSSSEHELRARGWAPAGGGGRRAPYEQGEVVSEAGEWLGVIKINVPANSLDAHCSRCKCKVNRTWRSARGSAQGRPMGLLLAFLRRRCIGDSALHRSLLEEIRLDFDERAAARAWGGTVASLEPVFAKERERRVGEADEPR